MFVVEEVNGIISSFRDWRLAIDLITVVFNATKKELNSAIAMTGDGLAHRRRDALQCFIAICSVRLTVSKSVRTSCSWGRTYGHTGRLS